MRRGLRRRAGLPARGRDVRGRPSRAPWARRAAACGSGRCTCRTGASSGHPHYDYKLAWLDALRDDRAGRAARPVRRDGRLQHRPDRRRRVGRRGRARRHARQRAGTRRAAALRDAGADRRRAARVEVRHARTPTGTTGPACSTRTWACASTWSTRRRALGRGGHRRLRRPRGPQGHRAVRPRARSSSTSRSERRRTSAVRVRRLAPPAVCLAPRRHAKSADLRVGAGRSAAPSGAMRSVDVAQPAEAGAILGLLPAAVRLDEPGRVDRRGVDVAVDLGSTSVSSRTSASGSAAP